MIVKIWQNSNVNINEQPVKVLLNPNVQVGVLKSSYPDANTPLADDDKFIVRQGSEYKEVNKSDVAIKQQFIYEYGGYWQWQKGRYCIPNSVYGVRSAGCSKIIKATPLDVISDPSVRGHIITKDAVKVKKLFMYLRYGYSKVMEINIGKKSHSAGSSILIFQQNVIMKHNGFWIFDINSDVEFNSGDEIILFMKPSDDGDDDTGKLYNMLNTILVE